MTIKHQVIYQHPSGLQEFLRDDEIPIGTTMRVKRVFTSQDGSITYGQEGTMQIRTSKVLLFIFPFCLEPYELEEDVFILEPCDINSLDGKSSHTPFLEVVKPLTKDEIKLQQRMYPEYDASQIISRLVYEPTLPLRSKR